MSINHFLNKIKGKIDIDKVTLSCLLVIILVGLSSFGLGRLSVHENLRKDDLQLGNENIMLTKEEIGNSEETKSNLTGEPTALKEKMYVASKNGKLFYTANCSGAKRISEKNEVWFASVSDAQKAGYELSLSCK